MDSHVAPVQIMQREEGSTRMTDKEFQNNLLYLVVLQVARASIDSDHIVVYAP